jgi:putative ABC transport system permease protein
MMLGIYAKLAFAGARRRRLQTALTLLVVAASAAALTIAMGVGRVADRPFDRTFEATNSPHVTAVAFDARSDLAPMERLPGVVATSGRRPVVFTAFRHDGELFGLRLIGSSGNADVPRLLLDEGSPPRPGEVVLERSFARFMGLGPGDSLAAGSGATPLRVSGIAVVSQGEAYPQSQPGVGFALPTTLASVEPDRARWRSALGVRLADPLATDAFMARAEQALGPRVELDDWLTEQADANANAKTVQIIISLFSVMLLIAGGAVLATLIGGRVLAQVRELGVLKAAGLTPGQVARVVLLEQFALALVGAVLGILVGTLATPLFVSESASLLNASETPSITIGTVVVVLGITLLAVSVFTLVPALRAGRRTTASLLAETTITAGHRSRLGRLADRLGLGVPTALGIRGSFARPGRSAVTTLSLALTVAAVVTTLGMEASLRVATDPPPSPPLAADLQTPAWDPVDDDAGEGDRLRPIVYGLDAVLLFVGLVNLVAAVLLGVRERVRDLGLLKAVGLTPRQLTSSYLTSQAVIGFLAALVGIPLGLALFRLGIQLDGSTDEFAYPWWWSLALLGPLAVATIVLLSAPLAHRAAEIRVTDALRYE